MPTAATATARTLRGRTLIIAAGLVLAAPGVCPAGAQDIGYTASVYVARGSYPGEDVTGVYVFNGVDVSSGPVRASLSVPFLRTTTTFLDNPLDPLSPAPAQGGQTSAGVGDPLIRADVRLFQNRSRSIQVGAAGSVKPGLVDPATGRGTGKADVAAGGTLFSATGRSSVFADLLYWHYGDPEGVDFEGTLSYSVGIGRALGSARWSMMVSLSGFSQGLAGTTAPLQVNAGLLRVAGRRQSFAVTAGVGLTSGADDFSLGASWRVSR